MQNVKKRREIRQILISLNFLLRIIVDVVLNGFAHHPIGIADTEGLDAELLIKKEAPQQGCCGGRWVCYRTRSILSMP